MQVPAPFEYARARSVDDAIALLEQHGEEARLVAGGHSLLPMMKLRLAAPEVLIDINELTDLTRIRVDGDMLRIGAMVRHAELLAVRSRGRALPDAARRRAGDRRPRGAQPWAPSAGRCARPIPSEDLSAAFGAAARRGGRSRGRSRRAGRCRCASLPPARTRPWSGRPRCSPRSGIPIRPGAGSAYKKVERRAGDWAVAVGRAPSYGSTETRSPTSASGSPPSGAAALPLPPRPRTRSAAAPADDETIARAGARRRRGVPTRATDQRGPADYKRALAGELTRAGAAHAPLRAAADRRPEDDAGDDDCQRRASQPRDRAPAATGALPPRRRSG